MSRLRDLCYSDEINMNQTSTKHKIAQFFLHFSSIRRFIAACECTSSWRDIDLEMRSIWSEKFGLGEQAAMRSPAASITVATCRYHSAYRHYCCFTPKMSTFLERRDRTPCSAERRLFFMHVGARHSRCWLASLQVVLSSLTTDSHLD